jgi:hypothetical protein
MTGIAWDGKQLAVDRLCYSNGVVSSISKYRTLTDGKGNLVVTVWEGVMERGLALARWYAGGAKPGEWPAWQSDQDWTGLIVAGPFGILEYEKLPEPQPLEEAFFAWGSGREIALGALSMGATAKVAVETASRWRADCGLGVDVFDIR